MRKTLAALAAALLLAGCGPAAAPAAAPAAVGPAEPPSLVLEISWAGRRVVTDPRHIGPLAEALALLPEGPIGPCAGSSIAAALRTGPGLEAWFTVTGDPPCHVVLNGHSARPGPEFAAAWGRILDAFEIPSAEPAAFYSAPAPAQLEPAAFGPVFGTPAAVTPPPENRNRIRRFSPPPAFPAVPAELPVFRTGPDDPARIAEFGRAFGLREAPRLDRDTATWAGGRIGYEPATGTFWFDAAPDSAAAPPWTTPPVNAAGFRSAAEQWLRAHGLWPPDGGAMHVSGDPAAGKATVVVYRSLAGLPFYAEQPLRAQILATRGVLHARGQQRPLAQASPYPLRTPQAAWQALQAGLWLERQGPTVFAGGASPLAPGEPLALFAPVQVELAYWEGPRDGGLVVPWYLFRDEAGRALYVPAVDAALAGW